MREVSQVTETTIKVSGMTCGHCRMAVTRALSALDGVKEVEVDLERGVAVVKHDEGRPTEEEMKRAVREAGYEA